MRRSSKIGILLGVFSLSAATALGMVDRSSPNVERVRPVAILLPYRQVPEQGYVRPYIHTWEEKRQMFHAMMRDDVFLAEMENFRRSRLETVR